jgi:hypothetical protein
MCAIAVDARCAQDARIVLERAGVVLFRDASANKVRVYGVRVKRHRHTVRDRVA